MVRKRDPKPSKTLPSHPLRVRIEDVTPRVDDGRYPAKRVIGDKLVIEADLVADGHDAVGGAVRFRHEDSEAWSEVALTPLVNDRWRGEISLDALGHWAFVVEGWMDPFATWRRGLARKVEVGQDVAVDLLIGAELVAQARKRASGPVTKRLEAFADQLGSKARPQSERIDVALGQRLAGLMAQHPDRSHSTTTDREYPVYVDRSRARFSAWYEFFPRSCGEGGVHGTFRDAERMLPHVAKMGFDVVYLPPIHPIGHTFRKGRNNSLEAASGDPGSPWAIGSEAGGHTAIHPELGSFEDLERFRKAAEAHGLELALDVAFQASPDHPWVREHPEWFKHRPDGTIQYAENPPKKYQDIYPIDFDSEAWPSLWEELLGVFQFWIDRGVRIFRVDNPHTKSLHFWEWCLAEIRRRHRDVIFLSEAFTRPKLMYALAKLGFTQSYTYFTWRNTSHEFREYMNELVHSPVAEFFRPNFWPNTPDILPEHLQHGGRGAFMARLAMAATLSSNYGMYGPAFELMEHVARPGSEEYIDNEKYEIKQWDLERSDSLRPLITRINRIRRENPALHDNASLCMHGCDNDHLLCYSKRDAGHDNVILVVVNLDFHHRQSGWVDLDLGTLGLVTEGSYCLHDLISDARYEWEGSHNYVELDPGIMPVHVFRVLRHEQPESPIRFYE